MPTFNRNSLDKSRMKQSFDGVSHSSIAGWFHGWFRFVPRMQIIEHRLLVRAHLFDSPLFDLHTLYRSAYLNHGPAKTTSENTTTWCGWKSQTGSTTPKHKQTSVCQRQIQRTLVWNHAMEDRKKYTRRERGRGGAQLQISPFSDPTYL